MFTETTPFVRLNHSEKIDIPVTGAARLATRFSRALSAYKNNDWMRCLILALVGILVRFPALQGERIWDDHYLACDNPFIKSPFLALEAFRHYLFLDSFSIHYRPVQNISYMADYFFWNTNEFGFHLTNVLLHVGGGLVLFFLLRRLLLSFYFRQMPQTRRLLALKKLPWISHVAFLIALVWTVHPVHSAAIDYISGRADSLAFLFASAGWLIFLRGRETECAIMRAPFFICAMAFGLFALCSREIAFVWIALFAAHTLFIDRTMNWRARICAVLCCVLLIGAYVGLRQLPGARPVVPLSNDWSISMRVSLMARALGDYGRLVIFPANLHMERTVVDPGAYRSNQEWRNTVGVEYLSIFGLLVLASFIFASAKPGPSRLIRIFGAGWFFAGYLPISNVVQLNATVAEHWLYLPSVGFLIFAAGCLMDLPKRYSTLVISVIILASAALSVRSYVRSTDWVTAETFYRRTMAAGGTSARTGLNLGQIYANRGELAKAEQIFRRVLELVPDYPIAQNNLASLLAREGKNKEAEALFAILEKNSMKTRNEFPCTWMGALNLARMRHNAKDDVSAIVILDRAQTYFPEVWELIRMKSEILREKKGPDAALRLVENFARTNWWHHGAALALGRLYAQRGDVRLADEALRRASRLDIHDTEALRLIVQMRLRENKFEEARRIQQRAIARQPDQPSQYVLLSDILEKMGREDEARSTLAQAARLRALVRSSTPQSL
jgi:Flp pilus assembly protein TadD